MSVSRVKYIKQFFPIKSYSFDSGNNVINVVANSHNLFSNVTVSLSSDINYGSYTGVATVVDANNFSVQCSQNLQGLTNFYVFGYLSGQTGNQSEQTLPRATGTDTIIQSYVNGTGGAAYKIDVSLDAVHWINSNTQSHSTTSGNTVFSTIKPGWAYYRANVTSLGANTNLVFMTGE